MLQAAAGGRYHIRAFAFLFLAAAVARFLSARCLSSQREPLPPGKRLHSPPLGKLIASLARDTNGRLLVYLLAAQAGVQIAGPYFTPFMLGHLGLNYFRYVIVICAASVARVLFLPLLGESSSASARGGSSGSPASASSPCPPCGWRPTHSPC